jgi:hypothetical protein
MWRSSDDDVTAALQPRYTPHDSEMPQTVRRLQQQETNFQ